MNPNVRKEQLSKPTVNGYGSPRQRNPSIGTLIHSKRYQQATPKQGKMERGFFSLQNNQARDKQIETKMEPRIQRLEIMINRLRIENSHAMSKSETLHSKNALLHKTLQHTKQQYTILDAENKKLKSQNASFQQQLNALKNTEKDDDTDANSVHSLKSQIANLEDTYRKGTVRNKKIKNSLEDVINDPGLPAYFRNKLVLLLPNLHSSEHIHSASTLSAQMRLDTPVTDILSILPQIGPMLLNTQSASTPIELHSKNIKYTQIKIIKPNDKASRLRKQRSMSNVSSPSYRSHKSAVSDELYFFKDSESEHDSDNASDDEEKELELRNKLKAALNKLDPACIENAASPKHKDGRRSLPSPKPRAQRRKPPPPPRGAGKHHSPQTAQSDDLTQIAAHIKNVKPNLLNLTQINEGVSTNLNRIRSASHAVHSPNSPRSHSHSPSNTSLKGNKGSPRMKNLTLDTSQSYTDDERDENQHKNRKMSPNKRVLYPRDKANANIEFDFDPQHKRSKSHKFTASLLDSSDDELIDNGHIKAKRSKFFQLGRKAKGSKNGPPKVSRKIAETLLARSHSARPSDSENSKAQKRRSMPTQMIVNRNRRKKNKKREKDMLDLTMSHTSDADAMSDNSLNSSLVMNTNPLSPALSGGDIFSTVIKHIDRKSDVSQILLSSPSHHGDGTNNGRLSLSIPNIKVSVSTPNSPILTPLKSPKTGKKRLKDDNDLRGSVRAVSRKVAGLNTKSFSVQITRNKNKKNLRKRSTITEEPSEPMQTPTPSKSVPIGQRTTRMDHIKMAKSNQLNTIQNRTMSKSISAASKSKSDNIEKRKVKRRKRRSSLNKLNLRKKTDNDPFELEQEKTRRLKPKRGRRSHQMHRMTHSRSMSLRKKDISPETRKKSFNFRRNTASIDDSGTEAMDSDDSLDDINKVWTLKDLIREMVSNGYDSETENRMRNALLLCHKTFTSSLALFEELRRFFRMSVTQMTSSILYFDDDEDDSYVSSEDRRWRMRHKITQCVLYWIDTYWLQDFDRNKKLQKEIEFFKSDIRSSIQDTNRAQQLLDSLMSSLIQIKTKFGGINPRNLHLPSIPVPIPVPIPPPASIRVYRSHSKSKPKLSAGSISDGDDSEEETSVIIHSSFDDDEDASDQRKKNTLSLTIQQRDRKASASNSGDGLPRVSTSAAAQNAIRSHEDGQSKKELDTLTSNLRRVEFRYEHLMKLEIKIPHNYDIMELDPEDVAVQLTLLDSFVFKKINDRECIQQNWKKKDKAIRAPNILKMIAQFNDVSKWVQLTILSGKTTKLRKRYIKKCISMASYFINNGNLSSLCAFYNALSSNNILSLQSTWKLLSKSKKKELQEIKTYFGWKMNKFKEIQEELQPPCIPHIGIILQALFQIDEGKQSTNPTNHSINYIKMMMLYEQVYNLEMLQSKNYTDEPHFLIQKLLIRQFKSQNSVNERQLYKLAKKVANSEKKTY